MKRFYLFVGIVALIVLGGLMLVAQDEKNFPICKDCEDLMKNNRDPNPGFGKICGHRTGQHGLKYCVKCAGEKGVCARCGKELPVKKDEPKPKDIQQIDDLIVHEWGVIQFCKEKAEVTSNPEEKDLPDFVHKWSDNKQPPKDEICPRCGNPIKKCNCGMGGKPILYFYTEDVSKKLNIRVGFNKGGPLYWWPSAERKLDKESSYLKWGNIELLDPKDRVETNFKNPGYAQWVSVARDTDSCILKLKSLDGKTDLYERFLFYEFATEDYKPKVKITTKEKEVVISGEGKEVFIVRIEDKKLEFAYSDNVNEKDNKTVELKETKIEDAMEQLIKVLKSAGLYDKEAKGMAKVWRKEFFEKEGVRAIYLMPQETYDKICPLEITPKPKEVKRVILVQVDTGKEK